MALTEQQKEIALQVNRSMDKRDAFGNFESFCLDFAARFLAALSASEQKPVAYRNHYKGQIVGVSFTSISDSDEPLFTHSPDSAARIRELEAEIEKLKAGQK